MMLRPQTRLHAWHAVPALAFAVNIGGCGAAVTAEYTVTVKLANRCDGTAVPAEASPAVWVYPPGAAPIDAERPCDPVGASTFICTVGEGGVAEFVGQAEGFLLTYNPVVLPEAVEGEPPQLPPFVFPLDCDRY